MLRSKLLAQCLGITPMTYETVRDWELILASDMMQDQSVLYH